MQNLTIKTGSISLNILDDSGESRGIFKFNPNDINLGRNILDLQKDFVIKQEEFIKKSEQCNTDEEKLNLLIDMVTYFKNAIDKVFGSNSSNILFGNALSIDMFDDFFIGIMPYFKKASDERLAKYKKSGK